METGRDGGNGKRPPPERDMRHLIRGGVRVEQPWDPPDLDLTPEGGISRKQLRDWMFADLDRLVRDLRKSDYAGVPSSVWYGLGRLNIWGELGVVHMSLHAGLLVCMKRVAVASLTKERWLAAGDEEVWKLAKMVDLVKNDRAIPEDLATVEEVIDARKLLGGE